MKRRRILLVVPACIVAAVVVVVVWPREREPEYKGKKLSEWISAYRWYPRDSSEEQEAAAAVQHIGTNALPYLVKWLGYEPPAWKRKLAATYRKLPQPVVSSSIVQWLPGVIWGRKNLNPSRPNSPEALGYGGFEILGERASPAVPELARLMNNLRRPVISSRAMSSLIVIGEPARAALSTSARLTAPDFYMRIGATNALERIEAYPPSSIQIPIDPIVPSFHH